MKWIFLFCSILLTQQLVRAQTPDSSNLSSQDASIIVTPGKPSPPPVPAITGQPYNVSAQNQILIQSKASDNNIISSTKDLEKRVANRNKDPFMLPNHIYVKIKRKTGEIQGEGYVDESVDTSRRWALKHYKLVGVIWGVKSPKAMISDKSGSIRMYFIKDLIGNNDGYISDIRDGEVIVKEKGTETKMRIAK